MKRRTSSRTIYKGPPMIDLLQLSAEWARRNRPDKARDETYLVNLAIEHVQSDILAALQMSRLGAFVVFQGGTALRKMYNGARFSEDLDFAISRKAMSRIAPDEVARCADDFSRTLTARLPERYGYEPSALEIRPPQDPMAIAREGEGGVVSTWRVSVPIGLEARGMRKRKIKVEIASVPAHTSDLRYVGAPCSNLPGVEHGDRVFPVERLEEIVADKIVALAARKALKGRDIWDLSFFATPDAAATADLVRRKVDDYNIGSMDAFLDRLAQRIDQLGSAETMDNFMLEMNRFTTGVSPDDVASTGMIGIARERACAIQRVLEESLEPVEEPTRSGPGF